MINIIEKFKNVLHEDEKVVDATTANKKTFIQKRILFPLILFILVTTILTIVAILNPHQYIEEIDSLWVNKHGHYVGLPLWVVFLVSGLLLLILLITWIMAYKSSNNYFICLTNKRIIVRRGIFTTDYTYYAIDNVSGNITINCDQSIFDKKIENACSLFLTIELLPVGHGELRLYTPSVLNGYSFAKNIDKQIKENSKPINAQTIKE